MITVYKYQLAIGGVVSLQLPINHGIVGVDLDPVVPETVCVWIRLDTTDLNKEFRRFWVTGTGHPAPHPHEATALGVIRMPPYIWHAFAETRL